MKYLPYELTREELAFFTPSWQGDRFPDGRPMVPDTVLSAIRAYVTVTHAWGVCRNAGFHHQTLTGFHATRPGEALVGRALCALYLPLRPDLREHMMARGHAAGEDGDMISWPIMRLVEGDVYVADVFGKVEDGPVIGDRLSSAIFARSQNGCVHNAAIRDIDGIAAMEGFPVLHKGMHPSHASPHTIMLGGINCPMRMEGVTVMPGDIVIARDDTVLFLPPHLAEQCAMSGMITHYRDEFGIGRVRERVYTPGQIDAAWTAPMEQDFRQWLARQPGLPFTLRDLDRQGEGRLW